MGSSQQSLLDTPKSSLGSCKILFVFVPLSAIIISAVVLFPDLIETSQSHHSMCHRALDPEACLAMVSEVPPVQSNGNVIPLLQKFLTNYAQHMDIALKVVGNNKLRTRDPKEQAALADCVELIDLSIDRATDSASALASWSTMSQANAQSWLSGVLTNHETCLDGLQASSSPVKPLVENLISRARASLAILAAITPPTNNNDLLVSLKGRFPSWVSSRDRKLLESSAKDIKADLVVAKDGSGDYQTLAEAVAAAPNKTKTRFVIYVKSGTYEENVELKKKKNNIMIVGDGMNSTVITGRLNYVDGTSTFRSATLAAVGDGFILQDICVQNTAGPEKHQAVALRVGADQSVINRCKIDAYQDTLYAHSNRQFYRECCIEGTIDFFFGNAAAVAQDCKFVVKKPLKNQKNMVTAQGRTDPNQPTGTSIQNCEIIASSDLEPVQSSFPTYLGRPWKEYSRTMVMQSYLGELIDPAGWAEWNKDFALNTLYYAEFQNFGPGAGTSKRVTWPGYRLITDPAEAMPFTVGELIQGGEWLKSTGVVYTEGLYPF